MELLNPTSRFVLEGATNISGRNWAASATNVNDPFDGATQRHQTE
jgi:hypothetical protein